MKNDLIFFQKQLLLEEKAPATVQKYTRAARNFARFGQKRALSPALSLAYKRVLAQKLSPRSVNASVAALNRFFEAVGRPDCRLKTLRWQRLAFCAEERELSRAEYERLCRAAEQQKKPRLLLLLQALCATGIRVGELPFLTVEAVRRGEAFVQSKGKARTVFLVRALRQRLLQYAARRDIESGPIFITRTGKPIDRVAVWREMKALCRAAGVDDRKAFPHNLRHLFARIFYEQEKDIAKLADLLGHSSIDTTRLYIVSIGAEHRRKMEKMRLIL